MLNGTEQKWSPSALFLLPCSLVYDVAISHSIAINTRMCRAHEKPPCEQTRKRDETRHSGGIRDVGNWARCSLFSASPLLGRTLAMQSRLFGQLFMYLFISLFYLSTVYFTHWHCFRFYFYMIISSRFVGIRWNWW